MREIRWAAHVNAPTELSTNARMRLEMHMEMRRGLAVVMALVACVGACGRGSAVPSLPPQPKAAASGPVSDWAFPQELVDPATPACDDFYQHACGGFLKTAAIPPGRSDVSWHGDKLDEQAALGLRKLLEEGSPANPEVERLRTFFASCMNEESAEASADRALRDLLARIDAIKTNDDFARVLRDFHALGVKSLFVFAGWPDRSDPTHHRGELDVPWLGLPSPQDTSAKGREQRDKYRVHVQRVFAAAGIPEERAAADAGAVLDIEQALSAPMVGYEGRYDSTSEHRHTLADLKKRAPHFDWAAYFAFVGYPADKSFNVTLPGYFEVLDRVLSSRPVGALRVYLRWSTLRSLAAALPRRFSPEMKRWVYYFDETPSRRHVCQVATTKALGVELSRQFSLRFLGPEQRAKATSAAEGLRGALIERVSSLDWLSSEARAAAVEKVQRTNYKIGYPDEWPATGTFALRDDAFFENVLAARTFETQREWERAKTEVRRSSWEMVVYPNEAPGMAAARLTIPNGYPDGATNSMIIPAAELQPPMFDGASPREVQYGNFGRLIGHEVVHLLENYKLDGAGKARDTWTAHDLARHDERTRCVTEQADRFVSFESLHVHGERTLGENIADDGGVVVAYRAMMRELGGTSKERGRDGLTREQRFFYAYAHGWCVKETPEAARRFIEVDVHAPHPFRVNGPLFNMPEFATAFGCAAGAKMTRPERERCSVW